MKKLHTLLAGSIAVLAVLAHVGGVSAHAALESSIPAAGSTVATSPASVSLTFAEAIQEVSGTYSLTVANASNASVTAGAPTISADGTTLSVNLTPNLPAGTYAVDWSNVSEEDGDSEEGAFTFAVGGAPVAQPTAATADHDHADPAQHADGAEHADDHFDAPTTGLIVVQLAQRGGSGVSGRAEIVPVDGGARTQIGVYVNGIVPGSSHMNHVHEEVGCSVATPGPHAAELTDVASNDIPYGRSLTIIDVPFAVVASGEHTIRVHAGPTGGDKTTIACGEIPAQPEAEHHGPVHLPSTGTGIEEPSASFLFGVLALAVGIAAIGAGSAARLSSERRSR